MGATGWDSRGKAEFFKNLSTGNIQTEEMADLKQLLIKALRSFPLRTGDITSLIFRAGRLLEPFHKDWLEGIKESKRKDLLKRMEESSRSVEPAIMGRNSPAIEWTVIRLIMEIKDTIINAERSSLDSEFTLRLKRSDAIRELDKSIDNVIVDKILKQVVQYLSNDDELLNYPLTFDLVVWLSRHFDCPDPMHLVRPDKVRVIGDFAVSLGYLINKNSFVPARSPFFTCFEPLLKTKAEELGQNFPDVEKEFYEHLAEVLITALETQVDLVYIIAGVDFLEIIPAIIRRYAIFSDYKADKIIADPLNCGVDANSFSASIIRRGQYIPGFANASLVLSANWGKWVESTQAR